jgi:hypothetical protein
MMRASRHTCVKPTLAVAFLITGMSGCSAPAGRIAVWDARTGREWSDPITRRLLTGKHADLLMEAVPAEEAFIELSQIYGANICPNWTAMETAAIEKDKEVTVRLSAVTLHQALRCVLDELGGGQADLAYEPYDGLVQVSTKEDLSRVTTIRIYDISGLLGESRPIEHEELEAAMIRQGYDADSPVRREVEAAESLSGCDLILYLVRSLVDTESWRETGGNVGKAECAGRLLIVAQTPTAHEEIYLLLITLGNALNAPPGR